MMIKRIVLSVVCVTITSLTLMGQSFNLRLSTNNQQVVENAVKDAFCILRQEFQLQDASTGSKYNLDSLGYFGYGESLCIKVKDGYITDKALMEPWKEDANVADYPGYTPVLSHIRRYDPELKEWIEVRRQTFDNYYTIGNTNNMFVVDSLFNNDGLSIEEEIEGKEGWLVWIYQQDRQLSFQSFRQKLDGIDPIEAWNAPEQISGKKLLCGIILSADYSNIGEIHFRLVDLMVNKADGWHAEPLKDCCKDQSKEHRLVEVSAPQVSAASEKASADNLPKKKQKKSSKI